MTVRIIRADRTRDDSSGKSFNFVDLKQEGEELLTQAQTEANELLASARREADRIRQQAMIDARETGRAEGLRDATTQVMQKAKLIADQSIDSQLATALPALRDAAASLQAERDRWLVRWEHTAVRLGVAIAEKLIRRQLSSRPEFATEMITEALRIAAGQPQLTVYLHPADLEAWGDRADQIVQSLTACADTTLVADDRQIRGGCRIETRHGEIDARVETMLQRIAQELVDA